MKFLSHYNVHMENDRNFESLSLLCKTGFCLFRNVMIWCVLERINLRHPFKYFEHHHIIHVHMTFLDHFTVRTSKWEGYLAKSRIVNAVILYFCYLHLWWQLFRVATFFVIWRCEEGTRFKVHKYKYISEGRCKTSFPFWIYIKLNVTSGVLSTNGRRQDWY